LWLKQYNTYQVWSPKFKAIVPPKIYIYTNSFSNCLSSMLLKISDAQGTKMTWTRTRAQYTIAMDSPWIEIKESSDINHKTTLLILFEEIFKISKTWKYLRWTGSYKKWYYSY
jgi:hypothetical protein